MKNLFTALITLLAFTFTTSLLAEGPSVGCSWNSWFEYPNNSSQYDEGADMYVKVKPERYQDIEYMKLYVNGQYIRKESNYPYEWCKTGSSSDHQLRNLRKGTYRLKVKIKDRCGYEHERECSFEVKCDNYGGGYGNCNWDSWFEYPNNGHHFDCNSDVYVKVKPNKYQDIEYMKLYVNGQFIRKESSYPYEWCKTGSSSDHYLRNMQPGHYKITVKIKDRCGYEHEKECGFEVKNHNNNGGGYGNCDWNSWFEYPNNGHKYNKGSNIYCKVKPNKYQDIEYMKLYVNGQYVRKESSYPYEWCKSNSSGDTKLRNMQPGHYTVKVKIKDKCGYEHEKECKFEIKH